MQSIHGFHSIVYESTFNSLAESCGCNPKAYFLNPFYQFISWALSVQLVLGECHWISLNMSIWVQVMAWCRQATSHYLSLCWPSSMSPYGVTRPHWIKFETRASKNLFLHPYFLIGLWRVVRISASLIKHNLWGAINFGLHTKYVKYEWFWCSVWDNDMYS